LFLLAEFEFFENVYSSLKSEIDDLHYFNTYNVSSRMETITYGTYVNLKSMHAFTHRFVFIGVLQRKHLSKVLLYDTKEDAIRRVLKSEIFYATGTIMNQTTNNLVNSLLTLYFELKGFDLILKIFLRSSESSTHCLKTTLSPNQQESEAAVATIYKKRKQQKNNTISPVAVIKKNKYQNNKKAKRF
jgi:hypothetical protein